MKYKNEILMLRQRIPIGLKQGLQLLEQTNGNLLEAETLFQKELITLVVNQTQTAEETAKRHLVNNDFDLTKTLQSIDEERLSSTELILKKYKNKENALSKIHLAIENESGLERKFSITEDSLRKLNACQYAFIVVLEWLDYEAFEGFNYALNFRLLTTIEVLKKDFLLTDVAKNLEKAFDYTVKIRSKYEHKWHWTKINNQMHKHKRFKTYQNNFEQHKEKIIDKLYAFVCENLSFFP